MLVSIPQANAFTHITVSKKYTCKSFSRFRVSGLANTNENLGNLNVLPGYSASRTNFDMSDAILGNDRCSQAKIPARMRKITMTHFNRSRSP